MSEFPEVFHPEAAREILDTGYGPDILIWFKRAIEEVESLYEQNIEDRERCLIAEQQLRDFKTEERLEKFKQDYLTKKSHPSGEK
jgi:hypothetical protein